MLQQMLQRIYQADGAFFGDSHIVASDDQFQFPMTQNDPEWHGSHIGPRRRKCHWFIHAHRAIKTTKPLFVQSIYMMAVASLWDIKMDNLFQVPIHKRSTKTLWQSTHSNLPSMHGSPVAAYGTRWLGYCFKFLSLKWVECSIYIARSPT